MNFSKYHLLLLLQHAMPSALLSELFRTYSAALVFVFWSHLFFCSLQNRVLWHAPKAYYNLGKGSDIKHMDSKLLM